MKNVSMIIFLFLLTVMISFSGNSFAHEQPGPDKQSKTTLYKSSDANEVIILNDDNTGYYYTLSNEKKQSVKWNKKNNDKFIMMDVYEADDYEMTKTYNTKKIEILDNNKIKCDNVVYEVFIPNTSDFVISNIIGKYTNKYNNSLEIKYSDNNSYLVEINIKNNKNKCYFKGIGKFEGNYFVIYPLNKDNTLNTNHTMVMFYIFNDIDKPIFDTLYGCELCCNLDESLRGIFTKTK